MSSDYQTVQATGQTPYTGQDVAAPLAAGGALLAVGVVLAVLARKAKRA